MKFNQKTLYALEYSFAGYLMSISLICQIKELRRIKDKEARSETQRRICRYIRSMIKVDKILQEQVVPLISQDFDNSQIIDPVKSFFLELQHTSSEMVQQACDGKLTRSTSLTMLNWFGLTKKFHPLAPKDCDLVEIMKSIDKNRGDFLKMFSVRDNNNATPFLHFCPQLAMIEKLTLVHIMNESTNSPSPHWADFCSKCFRLLGMDCQKYRDDESSCESNDLPYGIYFDLNQILLQPLEKNIRMKKDNFAQDAAITSVKAIITRLGTLAMHDANATYKEIQDVGHFCVASLPLIESLKTSKKASINSNKVSYHCTPPKQANRTSIDHTNHMKRLSFITGVDLSMELLQSLNQVLWHGDNSNETMTPREKIVSGWGIKNPSRLVRGDGSSPVCVINITDILEEELKGPSTTDSPNKERRVFFTPQEREWVMNGVKDRMSWSQILDENPILRINGKTEQNIREMYRNQIKKDRKAQKARETNPNQETNHSPKKRQRFSLNEKLAVIRGKARGKSWAEIKRDNSETLSERNGVNIKDLWRTISNGVEDKSILIDDHIVNLQKLEDHVRSTHKD